VVSSGCDSVADRKSDYGYGSDGPAVMPDATVSANAAAQSSATERQPTMTEERHEAHSVTAAKVTPDATAHAATALAMAEAAY